MPAARRRSHYGLVCLAWRALATIPAAALLLGVAGCRDDSAGAPAVDISGGERLAWSQAAGSAAQLQSLTFRLYIGGRAFELVSPRCDRVATGGGFPCSGGLPPLSQGRHVLELTSILAGVESPRSAPLVVNVTGAAGTASIGAAPASSAGLAAASAAAGSPPPVPEGPICATGTSSVCYTARVVASGLASIDSLAATPDGGLLLVEAGTRVRVVTGAGLAPEPALVLSDPSSALVGIAVGMDYAETRAVFVAWTGRAAGVDALSVTRYREVNGILGQGAQIVTNLQSVPAAAVVPLAVDDRGLLYLATPGDSQAAPGGPGQGLLLRVDRDGRTPTANPRVSPVLAYGLSQPATLVHDPVTRRMWLGGGTPAGGMIASVPVDAGPDAAWPAVPVRADTRAIDGGGSSQPGRLAVVPDDGGLQSLMLLTGEDRLWLGRPGPDGRLRVEGELPLGVRAGALAAAPGGAWYVATDDGHAVRVLRLERVR